MSNPSTFYVSSKVAQTTKPGLFDTGYEKVTNRTGDNVNAVVTAASGARLQDSTSIFSSSKMDLPFKAEVPIIAENKGWYVGKTTDNLRASSGDNFLFLSKNDAAAAGGPVANERIERVEKEIFEEKVRERAEASVAESERRFYDAHEKDVDHIKDLKEQIESVKSTHVSEDDYTSSGYNRGKANDLQEQLENAQNALDKSYEDEV